MTAIVERDACEQQGRQCMGGGGGVSEKRKRMARSKPTASLSLLTQLAPASPRARPNPDAAGGISPVIINNVIRDLIRLYAHLAFARGRI